MKVKPVSALRERGLRPDGRVAEPPVVGLAPQTTNERKANTMKTYILRDSKTVEPQKSNRHAPPPRLAFRCRSLSVTAQNSQIRIRFLLALIIVLPRLSSKFHPSSDAVHPPNPATYPSFITFLLLSVKFLAGLANEWGG